jgi:signal transduction histidine kinase
MDTGIGIQPEVLAGLFQPFVQSPRTNDRSTGGLGLALPGEGPRGAARGEVRASSDGTHRGATFVVRLPLDRWRTPRLAVVPPPARWRAVPRRILII